MNTTKWNPTVINDGLGVDISIQLGDDERASSKLEDS